MKFCGKTGFLKKWGFFIQKKISKKDDIFVQMHNVSTYFWLDSFLRDDIIGWENALWEILKIRKDLKIKNFLN